MTAAVPALVALAVVFIGGRQQRARQRDELAQAQKRWREERDFERERFALQERRKLYADYLSHVSHMVYLTTHALAHQPHGECGALCEDHEEDALQDWMQANNELDRLFYEVGIIGSSDFYGVAVKIHDAFDSVHVLDPEPDDFHRWIRGEGDRRPIAAVIKYLIGFGMMAARSDMLASPLRDGEEPEPDDPEELERLDAAYAEWLGIPPERRAAADAAE